MQLRLQSLPYVKVDLWQDGRTYRAEISYKGHHLGYFVRWGSRFRLYTYHYIYGIEATPTELLTHTQCMCISADNGEC